MVDVEVFTRSGSGKVNEDCVCHAELSSGVHVIAVADGMGGLSFGDVASRLVAESIVSFLKEGNDDVSAKTLLTECIEYANGVIRRECELRKARMGASVAVAVVNGGVCHFLSLGNVRIFHLRNHQIRQITEDHVNQIAGQAYLTRCVNGRQMRYPVEVKTIGLVDGDELKLATDGYYLHNNVELSGSQAIVGDDDATLVSVRPGREG